MTQAEAELGAAHVRVALRPQDEYAVIELSGALDISVIGPAMQMPSGLDGWTPRFSRMAVFMPEAKLAPMDVAAMQQIRGRIAEAHAAVHGERPVRSAYVVLTELDPLAYPVFEFLNSDNRDIALRLFHNQRLAHDWLTEPAWRARV